MSPPCGLHVKDSYIIQVLLSHWFLEIIFVF